MKKMCLLASICFFALQYVYPQNVTYRQNGVTVAGGNGSGSAANQLKIPGNMVVDGSGNIFIADEGNYRVQKWAPGAASGTTVAGGNGEGNAANQLWNPSSVRLDAAGNLYIADFSNHRVQKWAPGATAGVTVAGGGGAGPGANLLTYPPGLFVDAANNVYVADGGNYRVQKWAPGATSGITVAGGSYGTGPDRLYSPHDVFVDAAGNVYVADELNHRVQKWAPGATSGVTVAGGNGYGSDATRLNNAAGVYVDAAGNVYVADFFNDRIQKWAPGATAGVTVAGGNGRGAAANQLYDPAGIWFDAAGNMFVADWGNNRVQRFDALYACPKDLNFITPTCAGKIAITWSEPRDTFPDSIRIPQYLDQNQGILTFLTARDGHGYYKSTNQYHWRVAKEISEFLGDTGVNGHLVTITSAAESDFLNQFINNTGLTAWIGLYSTGKPGNFRWVTDEPVSYTRWATGEPNNYLGNAAVVAEPFVHLYDLGIWNDQRAVSLRFITEFEKPLILYKQVSGPANGSQQGVGTYTICYQRTNFITGQQDTCCFNITITCPAPVATQHVVSVPASSGESTGNGLAATAFPSPGNSSFTVKITSAAVEKISLQVLDVTGKVVETKSGLASNQTIQVGSSLKAGVYFVELRQGTQKAALKLVKQTK